MAYNPDKEICEIVRGDISGSKTEGLKLPNLTTAQRDAIGTPNFMIIWNSTTEKIEFHNGAAWIAVN